MTEDLKQRKKALLASEKPPRAREAAKQLAISEAEYVALSVGENVTALDNKHFLNLLLEIESLDEVMALTRNEAMVLEHHGHYQNGVARNNNIIFNNPDIDLRLLLKDWKYGFAVEENGRHSFQFYNQYGEACHKIYITDHSNQDQYQKMVTDYAVDELSITVEQKPVIEIDDKQVNKTDKEAIQRDWKALNDAHHVSALTKAYSLTRPQVYNLLEEDAVELENNVLKHLLEQASEKEMPLLMFVPNANATQIHNGTVKRIMEMGPWLNVLDPKFNLHANMTLVKQCWMVTKYLNNDQPTYSLELFDENDQSLMMVYLDKSHLKDESQQKLWPQILTSCKKQ